MRVDKHRALRRREWGLVVGSFPRPYEVPLALIVDGLNLAIYGDGLLDLAIHSGRETSPGLLVDACSSKSIPKKKTFVPAETTAELGEQLHLVRRKPGWHGTVRCNRLQGGDAYVSRSREYVAECLFHRFRRARSR